MESITTPASNGDVLRALRTDCKQWRRLASQYAQADGFISAAQEERYKALHSQILATCHNLAGEETISSSRRQASLQLKELLRPWSSTRNFRDAQLQLVDKLVESQLKLENQLRGVQRNASGQVAAVAKAACAAALVGIAVFLFLEWASDDATELLSDLTAYLRRTSFTEQFAIAVLFSWLFGTWLLSRLSSS